MLLLSQFHYKVTLCVRIRLPQLTCERTINLFPFPIQYFCNLLFQLRIQVRAHFLIHAYNCLRMNPYRLLDVCFCFFFLSSFRNSKSQIENFKMTTKLFLIQLCQRYGIDNVTKTLISCYKMLTFTHSYVHTSLIECKCVYTLRNKRTIYSYIRTIFDKN